MSAASPSDARGFLRPPPFPGLDRALSRQAPPPESAKGDPVGDDTIAKALCEAKVGGAYWGENWQGDPQRAIGTVLRASDPKDEKMLLGEHKPATVLPPAGKTEIDPWSILPDSDGLAAHGDDEWIAIASLLQIPVTVLSPGRFGAPGDTAEDLRQHALAVARQPMPDPFGDGWLDLLEAISLLADWRRVIEGNRGQPGERIVAACGMSWWKRDEISRFLWSPGTPPRIHLSASRAIAAAKAKKGAIAVWPSRISPTLIATARRAGVDLVRVEDGFVRSVGLGSNLVPPLSVIVDRRGIHYDPSAPSDLEAILAETDFSDELLRRAGTLREAIVAAGISKYARASGEPSPLPQRSGTRRTVLVTGQVEDDMSVVAGGGGLSSNLELLRRARSLEPDAEIWWRPHPDVDAGHRIGAVADEDALKLADRIVREGSMAELLDRVDALHVLTSLSGFEALMRGVEVTCHGVPFFSGWGLTRDLGAVPDRRGRILTIDELVAGVLVLYPRYLDPVTRLPCPPEVLVRRMAAGEAHNRLDWVEPLRRLQGRAMAHLRGKGGR